ncbi:ribonuclease III [bacterium]|nr:MAG: ribonuclease III [bacterium]
MLPILGFFKRRKLAPEQQQRIYAIERLIGIRCKNPDLFFRALTHRSKLADDNLDDVDSYEQLEFLGDAVLDLIVSEILFELYPNENEGFMTKSRSKLVKGVTLAKIARKMDLSSHLIVGERARGQGVEFSNSVLADVFEALVGALYRDSGYDKCSHFVRNIYSQHVDVDELVRMQDNYKSTLLEYTQANKMPIPTYGVISETGPAHSKMFHIGVYIGKDMIGDGRGQNKKVAEQQAAMMALIYLNEKESVS